ncbi:hypothetical protein [Sphingosinicella sp. BN140058]|uniref:hypothetical protein n=1 Tax=Sphingosinicella sp. BN140058 TaxID=1892855 RepID=UPI00101012EB|nr:hypothetical protein [Sphingosinicella sp. BN140058]QAY76365.1 hypothetical protein ETR14_07575 [Sphingosinicella sp. BN140058]
MPRCLPFLPSTAACAGLSLASLSLAGCAGYASDYWKPKNELIAAQLVRYGMAGDQGKCVETRLTEGLTVWELRQLSDLASRLQPGGNNPAAFGPRDFLYIASLVEDADVKPKTEAAIAGCGLDAAATPTGAPALEGAAPDVAPPAAQTASQPGAAAVPESMASTASAAGAAGPLWVNLGAAATGQGIAVDATSVTRGPSWRQAWFRLLNSDQGAVVGDIGYLLRIDCPARTITAHSGRKYAPGGALTEQKDYEKPEGPMAIEKGTVIEVAYHALCDDPR